MYLKRWITFAISRLDRRHLSSSPIRKSRQVSVSILLQQSSGISDSDVSSIVRCGVRRRKGAIDASRFARHNRMATKARMDNSEVMRFFTPAWRDGALSDEAFEAADIDYAPNRNLAGLKRWHRQSRIS